MKRFWKGIFGGILAILAAFGWTVAIVFILSMKFGSFLAGVRVGIALWITLFVIFAVGFYLAFRSAYSRRSN